MAQENSTPYDNIIIKNAVDGTTIQGHKAVTAYFRREEQLLKNHGSFLFFQIYRINMQAQNFKELQGNMLMEFKVNPALISETETVATVKNKIYPSLKQHSETLELEDADNVTLVFGGSRMNTANFMPITL